MSVNNLNFTSVFFKTASHANPGSEINLTGYKLEMFKQIFLKFSKTSTKSNTSLLRYKSLYVTNFFYFRVFTNYFPKEI